MKRRLFITRTFQFGLVGSLFPWLFTGCQVSSNADTAATPDSGSGSCDSNGATASVSSNHGHSLSISAADIQAGAEKTFNIQGTSAHNHTVTLSAAQTTSLSQGGSVTIASSDNGHSHSVTINCTS